jgi:TnpA family transposase
MGVTLEKLDACWTLKPKEIELVAAKKRDNQLGFALLLLHYRVHAQFPDDPIEILPEAIDSVVQQLGLVDLSDSRLTDFTNRTGKRHRAEIRVFFGFREATVADGIMLSELLQSHVPLTSKLENLTGILYENCRYLKIEPPSADRIARIVRTAISVYDERFCSGIFEDLNTANQLQLDALLKPADREGEPIDADKSPAILLWLRSDPGRPSLASVQDELSKLNLIRSITLPSDLFAQASQLVLERYRRRVAVEAPYELRRHPDADRLTCLAAFVHLRGRSLTDNLVDLLVETIHHIGARAERKVEREMLDDLKRVTGEQNLLFELADAAIENPDGIVREVVYPVVGEQTLKDLVKEWKATGPTYRTTLRTVIRNSYRGHYRRMVPDVLNSLAFRSNNERHRPVLTALELVKRYADTKLQYFSPEEDIPLDGVVRGLWRDAVIGQDTQGQQRINRITYEICVLEALRDRLRCKEIWVDGANRYRDPDDDLPKDFETQRTSYYQALHLPLDAEQFIASVQADLREALATLDAGLQYNPWVRISPKGGGRITITPLVPQPDPANLTALKGELTTTWPMTSLLDIIKESDLRLKFTDTFKSQTSYESMGREILQPRLLLCLHGLGTNTGLQRMVAPLSGVTHRELSYVRRRYISSDVLRHAIGIIANGTLQARNPLIWGNDNTACASDSKHFGAWDQNLTTQWHVRYGGRGIMIYWHVDKNSLCIHSQLKSPASSEVASMIHGVLHHCTEMEVDRQYVDSHGQSTVAFAFCKLLGFQLLLRLKAIPTQKLYRPETGNPEAYQNLSPVLSKAIDWDLIHHQYDQMVKYATALRLGTAETESILRRFTRGNVQHPTYKAFSELGKATKTIFLCRYLHSEELRREINGGLNVIEQWNGATDFVRFARRGEFVSNVREDHEVSMLALHLIQDCMVYINTLMLQQLLAQPQWNQRLTTRDRLALTPLIWEHVNPYGRFELDMSSRLPLL